MWRMMARELRMFSLRSTLLPFPSSVFAAMGKMSDMKLCPRSSRVKLVNPFTGEISDIELFQSPSDVRLVNPTTGEMSYIELLSRLSRVKLVNSDRGEMLYIELSPRSRYVRLVSPARGEMSYIELPPRSRYVRLVNSDRGEMSDIKLLQRLSAVRLVNSARGDRSETELLLMKCPSTDTAPRYRLLRLVACSRPVKSVILASRATNLVILARSALLMWVPDALFRAFSIAVRRLESGISPGNTTVTPLCWRVGMWVLTEALLRGFSLISTLFPFPNPVFVTRGERSDIELPSRRNQLRLVNPDRGEMLYIELFSRSRLVSLFNAAKGEISVMALLGRYSHVS